jgi:hypothetical protein
MFIDFQQYEKLQLRNIAAVNRKIKQIYEESIREITVTINTVTYKNKLFSLDDYPVLKNQVEKVASKMQGKIFTAVINGVEDSWDLANQKNNVIVDKRLAGLRVKQSVRQILYDPNKQALKEFLTRKEKGLNLSERVWNLLDPFKKELEQTVGLGLGEGMPAAEIAKQIKKYLNEPEKLFRRVRGEDGKLHLSAAARNYHPGQGVYRSSYKNAIRISRTETNIAYRSADFERWKTLPFVLGIEVKLSKNHPRFDICDHLVGVYPKDFKFTGWHPNCICFQVPKMMNDEEFSKLEDQILEGKNPSATGSAVTNTPPAFRKYLQDNGKRIAGWSNQPYWIRDNQKYVRRAALKDDPHIKPDKNLPFVPAGKQLAPQLTNIDAAIMSHVKESLKAIDSVHGDGDLLNIPFEKASRKRYLAAFHSTIDGRPVKIDLAQKEALTAAFNITHEIGHYLDLYVIGQKGIFGSIQAGSAVAPLLKAAQKTNTVKTLQKMLDDGFYFSGETKIPVSPGLRVHIQYLLRPKEIWARAYSQFIAKRGVSTKMKKALQHWLDYENGTNIPAHWKDADFTAMEKEIEKMMFDLKWISQ